MSLKRKVIGLLLGVFAIYAVVEFTVQRFVLMPSFVALERATATSNTERAMQALEREAELLLPSARDWGTWDDTYGFVADRSRKFVAVNLSLTSMKALGVNLLGLYDERGRRIWVRGYNLNAGTPLQLGDLSADALPMDHPLMGYSESTATVTGLYRTPGGTFVLVATPILKSDGTGPCRGRVVMGRIMDHAAIARLGAQARVRLRVDPVTASDRRATPPADPHSAVAYTRIALDEAGEITHGRTTVLDVSGHPVLRFEVDTPRTIVAQGRKALHYATVSLLFSGLGVLLVLLALLRHTVFAPVSRLTRHAIAVGADDLSARLDMNRADEIGVLAREFDRMVGRLAETRQRLLDQSYRSGVAEMANGVLHNIGNSITPLGVKLSRLKTDLDQAPAAEIEMAVAELAGTTTPDDRRADLNRFLGLAGQGLVAQIRRASDDLEAIQAQVQHVQAILADQQRFIRSDRLLEPLAPRRMIDESVSLVPEGLREIMTVEIDPAMDALGHIWSSRTALHQVFTNLLINAAESIRERGQTAVTGRVRILVLHDEASDPAQAHLCFEDNGAGIPAEHLSHIFERGFSTKNRGSGMGLHWSANTLSALGGRLSAESAGIGQGARLHVWVPLEDVLRHPVERAA